MVGLRITYRSARFDYCEKFGDHVPVHAHVQASCSLFLEGPAGESSACSCGVFFSSPSIATMGNACMRSGDTDFTSISIVFMFHLVRSKNKNGYRLPFRCRKKP